MPPLLIRNSVYLECDFLKDIVLMQFDFKTLLIERPTDAILLLTLNRPAARNAINYTMMEELLFFWQTMHKNLKNIRCIIIIGKAPAFCAGADLKERLALNLSEWKSQHAILRKAMLSMLDCPIPIIAAVNGAAFGGGLELVLASDFAYAASTAIFSQSEVKIGIIPGALGTQHLPRAVGLNRAKELTFTGRSFSAEEACAWGLVNQICDEAILLKTVLTTAQHICDNAPLAIIAAKKTLNFTQNGISMGFDHELENYHAILTTKDREEGIRAFNEKRLPVFKGE